MHDQARHFIHFVRLSLGRYFVGKKVLDVGSGDINGNNRYIFERCEYDGNDVVPVNNVTIVSKTKDLPFPDNTFDTIVSTECFEHDPDFKLSLQKIYKMLKPGGLFFFTCASTGRPEHGTRRTTPFESFGTIGLIPDMVDYYQNVTEKDLNDALPLKENFSVWDTYYNAESKDLYFLGIKNGYHESISLPNYAASMVEKTSEKI
jgi:SAM-dependent methyltransferase